jgi:hypothetical protein
LPIYDASGGIFGLGTSNFACFKPHIHKGDLKMKISKQRLKQILKEELEMANMTLPNGEIDREGRMAKRQLADIAEYAHELSEMLADETQLEAWVQAKITKAADYISKVKHYLEYEMKDGKMDMVSSKMSQNMPEMGEMTLNMPQMGQNMPEMGDFEEESEESYEF